ncbi:sugar ABC transporter permease [Paenibacillus baekrokdamisoli]|uniref:Sugar ABC transporter permease n=1 Tax=Paenibacillus baekrokdamisoli TaxID=1712516 RepID=A0A3G9IKI6_9BACL|nr:carbohydrate ABC transporter permease [Paenibacillus baekrokdamisoli]MBB3067404.1 raffinose/stachyose/melibiose transport system permease protein [Paenibacillus baekrokdamisoli]BBH19410.1 sugar ABC transporter permease [Paenibacillus baekrokdamisoli]
MKLPRKRMITFEVIMGFLGLVYIYPILLVIINSIKTSTEVMNNAVTLPKFFSIHNYVYVWKYIDYARLFLNNIIVTSVGVLGIVFIGAIAAYKLSRTDTKYSWYIFIFCITPMLIPFQSIMITVLKLAKTLHLTNSVIGLGIQYWGFGAPMAIFIYHSFVKGIPREIDESSLMDGASSFTSFVRIIFPLLKPVTTTIIIINFMWIWNDFLLPLLMINGSNSTKTLSLAAYSFVGQYTTDWQYTLTAVVMTVLPAIIFFIALQKYIVRGVTDGAIKG